MQHLVKTVRAQSRTVFLVIIPLVTPFTCTKSAVTRLVPRELAQMLCLTLVSSAMMDVTFVKKRKEMYASHALLQHSFTKASVSMNVLVLSAQAESLQMRTRHHADLGS